MTKKTKIIIFVSIIIVIVGIVIGKLYYDRMAERNHAYFETKEVIEDLENYETIHLNHNVPDSLFEYINSESPEIQIPITSVSGNTNVDGYKDLNLEQIDIILESGIEIEHIDPSDELKSLEIVCYGDGTHELVNFSEYFPNLTSIYIYDCNFHDNYEIEGDDIDFVVLENNTNFKYESLNNLKDLRYIEISDSKMKSDDIPIFSDSVKVIYIYMKNPFKYSFDNLPENIETFWVYNGYIDGDNEDTIYGLENYNYMKNFEYDYAKYITKESHEYAIENDISGIPDDLEVIE